MSNNTINDIDVLSRERGFRCGETSLDDLPVFFKPEGAPDLCMGLDFHSTEITLFYSDGDEVKELYVESPVESGGMSEYEPTEAVRALLAELGLSANNSDRLVRTDRFKATLTTMVSADAIQKNLAVTQITVLEDLMSSVEDAYEDISWE